MYFEMVPLTTQGPLARTLVSDHAFQAYVNMFNTTSRAFITTAFAHARERKRAAQDRSVYFRFSPSPTKAPLACTLMNDNALNTYLTMFSCISRIC